MRRVVVVLMALLLVGCAMDSPFELDLEALAASENDDGDGDDDDGDGAGGDGAGDEGAGAEDDGSGEAVGDASDGAGSGAPGEPDAREDAAAPPADATAAFAVLRALEQPDADHDLLLTARASEQLEDGDHLASLSDGAHLDIHAGTWERHNHLATVTVEVVGDDGAVQATYLAWLLHRPIDDEWLLSGLDLVTDG